MFPQTNFFNWLIIAPKATKTPAVAFVCDKSNVYLIRGEEWLSMAACRNGRTDEACALSFQCLMRGLLSLEKRWYVLTSCDWNKGCSNYSKITGICYWILHVFLDSGISDKKKLTDVDIHSAYSLTFKGAWSWNFTYNSGNQASHEKWNVRK